MIFDMELQFNTNRHGRGIGFVREEIDRQAESSSAFGDID
jgi:hypothetical protein